LIRAESLDAGEQVHLYGQGGEDVFLVEQAHVLGGLTKLLSSAPLLHRFEYAIHVRSAHRLQLNQDLANLPPFLHEWFAPSNPILRRAATVRERGAPAP